MSQEGNLTFSGSGASPIETITGNAGGPVGPDATFNIDLLGNTTTGIMTVGNPGLNTITIIADQATTTQFGTIQLATNAEAIAGVDTNKAVTSDDLKAKLGVQTVFGLPIGSGDASSISWTAAPTDGQLLIGSTGLTPVLNTLTAGSGISIANGAGSITISSTGGITGSGSTTGAVTDDIITISLGAVPQTSSLTVQVSAFEGSTPSAAGYTLFNVARTDGAVATLLGITVKDIIEEAALNAADADIIVSGNDLIVQVTGVAGLTISWTASAIQVEAP